jgi:hypothetical protein
MAMYSFAPPFREEKFCDVPSCVFDKLGCATSEKYCGTLLYIELESKLINFLKKRVAVKKMNITTIQISVHLQTVELFLQ